MDALEYLKEDHAHVRELMGRMLETTAEQLDLRHQLFELFRQELEIHMQMEEDVFYPEVERQGSHEQELVRDSRDEHQSLRDLLAQLETTDFSDGAWKQRVIALNEVLEHHLSDEELEMFPRARGEIGSELQGMGDRLYQQKSDRLRQYGLP